MKYPKLEAVPRRKQNIKCSHPWLPLFNLWKYLWLQALPKKVDACTLQKLKSLATFVLGMLTYFPWANFGGSTCHRFKHTFWPCNKTPNSFMSFNLLAKWRSWTFYHKGTCYPMQPNCPPTLSCNSSIEFNITNTMPASHQKSSIKTGDA